MKEIIASVKNIDNKIKQIMYNGFKFATIVGLIGFYILTLYKLNPFSHVMFTCGLLIFKNSLMLFASFFVCGIAVNKIKG